MIIAKTSRKRTDGTEPVRRVVAVALSPGRGVGLQKRQPAAQAIRVGITDGVVVPGAILAHQKSAAGVTVNRGADRIQHVREAIQCVIAQDDIGAYWIDNVCKIACLIVFVRGRTFGRAPAIGQTAVRVILIAELVLAMWSGGCPVIILHFFG